MKDSTRSLCYIPHSPWSKKRFGISGSTSNTDKEAQDGGSQEVIFSFFLFSSILFLIFDLEFPNSFSGKTPNLNTNDKNMLTQAKYIQE